MSNSSPSKEVAVPEEWMYFKAGAYTLNNTGDGTDFDQVTFYELENSHDEYTP